ncbi:hypothetical protein GT94_11615 [Geobacillus stearothermophilus]|nr:hypothetical protein GT94_11615 [Geobacillus stearothermophilus]OQP07572.1 hypothetical protein B1690_03315 [Geobacillus sp. 46C-IIa]
MCDGFFNFIMMFIDVFVDVCGITDTFLNHYIFTFIETIISGIIVSNRILKKVLFARDKGEKL